jgi:hypothetical protein
MDRFAQVGPRSDRLIFETSEQELGFRVALRACHAGASLAHDLHGPIHSWSDGCGIFVLDRCGARSGKRLCTRASRRATAGRTPARHRQRLTRASGNACAKRTLTAGPHSYDRRAPMHCRIPFETPHGAMPLASILVIAALALSPASSLAQSSSGGTSGGSTGGAPSGGASPASPGASSGRSPGSAGTVSTGGANSIGPGGTPLAPGASGSTIPTQRIGPGGVPLATGPSGLNIPTQRTGPAGVPIVPGPAGEVGGTPSPSIGRTSLPTSSGGSRPGGAATGSAGTTTGSIGASAGCAANLGPSPRIMVEEPGRPDPLRQTPGC